MFQPSGFQRDAFQNDGEVIVAAVPEQTGGITTYYYDDNDVLLALIPIFLEVVEYKEAA